MNEIQRKYEVKFKKELGYGVIISKHGDKK
jgi:hypothetical protein